MAESKYQIMLDHARAISDYCKSTECDKCVFKYAYECQIRKAPCSWKLNMGIKEIVHRLESIREGRPENLETQALELAITILKGDIKDETT